MNYWSTWLFAMSATVTLGIELTWIRQWDFFVPIKETSVPGYAPGNLFIDATNGSFKLVADSLKLTHLGISGAQIEMQLHGEPPNLAGAFRDKKADETLHSINRLTLWVNGAQIVENAGYPSHPPAKVIDGRVTVIANAMSMDFQIPKQDFGIILDVPVTNAPK